MFPKRSISLPNDNDRLTLPTLRYLWEAQGLSSNSLPLLQQQVTSQKPSQEASGGILPEHTIKNYQSYLPLDAKLREDVISGDTMQDHCRVPHRDSQGCFTLGSGLAFVPLRPENICHPRVAQQPPITYARSMKKDDVSPISSSGLLTLHAMEGVNCFAWS